MGSAGWRTTGGGAGASTTDLLVSVAVTLLERFLERCLEPARGRVRASGGGTGAGAVMGSWAGAGAWAVLGPWAASGSAAAVSPAPPGGVREATASGIAC